MPSPSPSSSSSTPINARRNIDGDDDDDDDVGVVSDDGLMIERVVGLQSQICRLSGELVRNRANNAETRDAVAALQEQISASESVARTNATILAETNARLHASQAEVLLLRQAMMDSEMQRCALMAERDAMEVHVKEAWHKIAALTEELNAARAALSRQTTEMHAQRRLLDESAEFQYTLDEERAMLAEQQAMSSAATQDAMHQRQRRWQMSISAAVQHMASEVDLICADYRRALRCGTTSIEEKRLNADHDHDDDDGVVGGGEMEEELQKLELRLGRVVAASSYTPTVAMIRNNNNNNVSNNSSASSTPVANRRGVADDDHHDDVQHNTALLLSPLTPLFAQLQNLLEQLREARRHARTGWMNAQSELHEQMHEMERMRADLLRARVAHEEAEGRQRQHLRQLNGTNAEAREEANEARTKLAELLNCVDEWAIIHHHVARARLRADQVHLEKMQEAQAHAAYRVEMEAALAQAKEIIHVKKTQQQQQQRDDDDDVVVGGCTRCAKMAAQLSQMDERLSTLTEENRHMNVVYEVGQREQGARDDAALLEQQLVLLRVFSGLGKDFGEVVQQRRALWRLLRSSSTTTNNNNNHHHHHHHSPLLRWRAAVVAVLAVHRLRRASQPESREVVELHAYLPIVGCPRVRHRVRLPAETCVYLRDGVVAPPQMEQHMSVRWINAMDLQDRWRSCSVARFTMKNKGVAITAMVGLMEEALLCSRDVAQTSFSSSSSPYTRENNNNNNNNSSTEVHRGNGAELLARRLQDGLHAQLRQAHHPRVELLRTPPRVGVLLASSPTATPPRPPSSISPASLRSEVGDSPRSGVAPPPPPPHFHHHPSQQHSSSQQEQEQPPLYSHAFAAELLGAIDNLDQRVSSALRCRRTPVRVAEQHTR